MHLQTRKDVYEDMRGTPAPSITSGRRARGSNGNHFPGAWR